MSGLPKNRTPLMLKPLKHERLLFRLSRYDRLSTNGIGTFWAARMKKGFCIPFVLWIAWACRMPVEGQEGMSVPVARPSVPARTITVGGDQADIQGFTSDAIQTAVEAVRHSGGGSVRLTAGTFDMTAPVRLYSGVSLIGSGITDRYGFLLDSLNLLCNLKIAVAGLHASSFRITFLLDRLCMSQAVQALHKHFLETNPENNE